MGPALAVGCSLIAKPDEHTPLSTLELAQLGARAGLPPGVFNVLTGPGTVTGRLMVEHPVPGLITFTGSTQVGKEIQAASARYVRKTILELGGNCPAIVCEDASWRDLLPQFVQQSLKNSGQYCYRTSRFYVQDSIYEDFLRQFIKIATTLRVGHPKDPDVQLGPLNNADILARVRSQVETAVEEGARVECGGNSSSVSDRGFYYPPTVLTRVGSHLSILQEEVFGPVVLITPLSDMQKAIEEANATPYGLAAYLFTTNLANAMEWANRLEVGSVWVNRIHQAYHEAPFGGMKESGLGREKSRFGLEEYTELKTIYLSY
jgi:succinate-semialdehyde dehydrogenase/glutarate-semialdehyde dehydrogenase